MTSTPATEAKARLLKATRLPGGVCIQIMSHSPQRQERRKEGAKKTTDKESFKATLKNKN